MSGTNKYGTVEGDKSRKYGLGSSSPSILNKIFKQSVSATLTHAGLVELAKKLLTPSVQEGDASIWPAGKVSLDYTGSPDLTKAGEVAVGGGGLPSTAWSPNLDSPATSPAGGTINPGDIPAMDAEAIPKPGGTSVIGADGLTSPAATSAEISKDQLGKELPLGTHTLK